MGEEKQLLISIERQLRRDRQAVDHRRLADAFIRLAAATVLGKLKKHDAQQRVLERAATNPAMTTVPGWAQELIGQPAPAFLLSLASKSAFAALAARGEMVSLTGLPTKAITGADVSAGFVAEGQAISVVSGSLTGLLLSAHKIAAIVTFSEELANSTANLMTTLRRLLSDACSEVLDEVFFSDSAASPAAPKGVLSGSTLVPPSAAADPNDALIEDMQNLVKELDAPQDPCFVVAPPRLIRIGAVLPGSAYPVFASAAVPIDRLICVDGGALLTATMPAPKFSISEEAALAEEPAPATELMGGQQVRSFYQTDTLGLRTLLWATWAVRSGGASFTEPVAW